MNKTASMSELKGALERLFLADCGRLSTSRVLTNRWNSWAREDRDTISFTVCLPKEWV